MPKYHPDRNPGALPVIRTLNDVETLPWGGNAWWDLPIMAHVERAVRDESTAKKAVRREMLERAGWLMMGEDCRFANDAEFDEYLAEEPG
jgi:hypothetical protein